MQPSSSAALASASRAWKKTTLRNTASAKVGCGWRWETPRTGTGGRSPSSSWARLSLTFATLEAGGYGPRSGVKQLFAPAGIGAFEGHAFVQAERAIVPELHLERGQAKA